MDVQTRDPSTADARFSFSTKDVRVKAPEDGDDEATRIEVPVSGLAEDRDGDKLADAAIDSMVNQINEGGVPMFANHGYDADNGVPQAYRFEDIIGGWSTAERDGDVVIAEADLREGHESVEDLKDLFAQSMPVGFSIGFGWGEGDAEERDSGGLRFRDVDLMEISPVGIQSHPDASTTGGMKVASALEAAGFDPADLDEQALAKALQETMTTKEEDEDENEEEEQSTTSKAPEEIINVIEAHMTAMMEDVREVMEGEGDMDEDEEESEGYDEEDEEDEKTAALEEELESVKAELEAMKTDAAGTQERKGGMIPSETDENDEQETKDDTPAGQTDREFARNLV
jgi:hypothetical protein